jgi:magnesium transporter
MDDDARGRLLAAAPEAAAREWRDLLAHPPENAGRVMDVRYISFREGMTAGQAMARIRRFESHAGVIFFLTDNEGRLRARVGLKAIALADPDEPLDDLSRPIVAVVKADDPRAEVAEAMRERNVLAMPVVDNDGRLIGVIHYDALVEAIRDEATVDIQTMFGASKDERALSPALFSVRKRLPWMEINLLTAFLAAAVVGAFESTIAKYTALAVLLPVVAGQSGNAGAQALAVTIRGLALREFRTSQWLRVAVKELQVGLMNGIAVAVTTGLVVLVWSGSVGLAGVIFLSMIISMVIAGVSGAMVPVALARLGQDPAQSSSIVLTTITDIFGFLSFLGIATILASTLPT